jgi:hypothetical protein
MTPDYTKGHDVVVTGLAQWAKITEASGPSDMSKKYQMDLVLSKESIDDLANLGERVYAAVVKVQKRKKDSEELEKVPPFVTLKSQNAPKVYTLDKKEYKGLIGNESLMKVKGTLKAYEYMGKKGLSFYINGAIILDLKEYKGSSANLDDLWEGVDAKQAPINDLPF